MNPLKDLIENAQKTIGRKYESTRVFLLTDGQVSNTDSIVECASKARDEVRVHTFGIGDDCDKQLVKRTAIAGRGSYSFVGNHDQNLEGVVVQALKKSVEASLKDCLMFWITDKSQDMEELNEVFRNDMVTRYRILPKKDFESLKVKFQSQINPITLANEQFEITQDQSCFQKVEGGKGLFKLAAMNLINKKENVLFNSLRYQVLSDETAMVGVVKQKSKETGQL